MVQKSSSEHIDVAGNVVRIEVVLFLDLLQFLAVFLLSQALRAIGRHELFELPFVDEVT